MGRQNELSLGSPKVSTVETKCALVTPFRCSEGSSRTPGISKFDRQREYLLHVVWEINAFGYVVGSTDLNSGKSSMFTARCQ